MKYKAATMLLEGNTGWALRLEWRRGGSRVGWARPGQLGQGRILCFYCDFPFLLMLVSLLVLFYNLS